MQIFNKNLRADLLRIYKVIISISQVANTIKIIILKILLSLIIKCHNTTHYPHLDSGGLAIIH